MPWKSNYTTSDEIGLRDGQILWPEARQMALGLTVNLNPAGTGKGVTGKDLAYPTWHFGMSHGLDAFLKLFNDLGVRATFAVPAIIAVAYPRQIETILAEGHEIAAQGLFGEDSLQLSPETEAAHMERATEILSRIIGAAPRGWFALSRPDDRAATGCATDHTAGLLRERGYRYIGNGLADDAPYWWVSDFDRHQALLALPYYYHFDDTFFLMFPREGTGLERPQALLRGWRAELRAQYRRGRYFNICVSPARSGWGHRFDNLATFLRETMALPGIWAATGAEIADYWHLHYPAETTLKLAPSIWRDYADSLS
ncbi:peptidoglycan/xylan/chitin deacetylase (PgdA/CDA1 family) [Paracoccus pantotrophus]|uniref:Chitooligosaccharide deacetylase n=1 Tax=Paracoccus pantotrophus TaxID=82367 RepID=A0AAE6NWG6_PARPN|nr:polysaccharide deacetylase family protein [Paracoccus pantotrophus]QFG37585.1 polysaccharide deacetylase family protein [Paracoccus pantotrophus]RKS51957.1 peptidoglycan/xylan/chitin deacetylase (PgdA/CDA1 family) [Paracoccus pantotrophus]